MWVNRLGFGPIGWDLDQQARIWALSPRGGGRTDRRTDRRTDGRTYVMVHPCVLQDIGPLGPLPKKGDTENREKDGDRLMMGIKMEADKRKLTSLP